MGLSHTTLQVTHHIDGDVDAERDHLIDDWRQTGRLQDFYWLDDFHKNQEGKNGGGDRYFTDGRLAVAFAMNRASGPWREFGYSMNRHRFGRWVALFPVIYCSWLTFCSTDSGGRFRLIDRCQKCETY